MSVSLSSPDGGLQDNTHIHCLITSLKLCHTLDNHLLHTLYYFRFNSQRTVRYNQTYFYKLIILEAQNTIYSLLF